MAKNPGWACVEPGWWTHDKYGGVCLEENGKWSGYPLVDGEQLYQIGPFATMQEAINALEAM